MERRYRALELRKLGKTYQQIAAELGVNPKIVQQEVVECLAEVKTTILSDLTNHYLLELERLDAYQVYLNQVINEAEDARIVVLAIGKAINLTQERAKLLGFYTLNKIDIASEIKPESRQIDYSTKTLDELRQLYAEKVRD